ncbi:ATP-grasp domain-containing protein [Neolewinella agarilytica]|uniref:ATP-grasp domain-containing protein n=1 Tax=Neolewinella agarilytica TaxID=478744 RepID=UPI002356427E|nr:ATP-grasp domain-containing protein [Neolewinella agarilytica]
MPKLAVLYQSSPPPPVDGISKPMKPGGYADSGADIAFSLQQAGVEVVLPVSAPRQQQDTDWVFPDTAAGIESALQRGATILWLNTVLYAGHAIEAFFPSSLELVGQLPLRAGQFDDKLLTNDLLRNHGLPVPDYHILSPDNYTERLPTLTYPIVVKPVRGRGSQGVTKVDDAEQAGLVVRKLLESAEYGDKVYTERFLDGQEITVSVLPPGTYNIRGQEVTQPSYWCLPPVVRFNHDGGIAPYNGSVAVIHNSRVLSADEAASPALQSALQACAKAAHLVGAKAVIRIDCRADAAGNYFLFDLNMKPNMTGNLRLHRQDQQSLTGLAAREIGWSYQDLLLNLLGQRWKAQAAS